MKRDMKKWIEDLVDAPVKRAMPVLSFPSVQLMGITVRELIQSSEHQARAMQMVAERTPAAASVSLMDLSVEAECFGSTIHVSDDEVPTVVGSVVHSEEDAKALAIPPVGACRTGLYIDAIRQAAQLIEDRPVFAGVIGPYSLAGRLMDVTEIMYTCYDEPETVHLVLEKATHFLTEYILAYKQAGANGVVMAEPLAGLLSPALSEEFSCAYVQKIVDAVQDRDFIVIYHNCGNAVNRMVKEVLAAGCAAYHFGNAVSMEEILGQFDPSIPCMGNVDPAGQFRGGTPESIREVTLNLLNTCSKHPNFVISSGCDIPPASKWENIDAFFAAVNEFYAR